VRLADLLYPEYRLVQDADKIKKVCAKLNITEVPDIALLKENNGEIEELWGLFGTHIPYLNWPVIRLK